MISQLTLCRRRHCQPPEPCLYLHGFNVCDEHCAPPRQDVDAEVAAVHLDGCRRPIDIGVVELVGLEMFPGFGDRDLSNPVLLGVDLDAQLLNSALGRGFSRIPVECSDDPFLLDATTIWPQLTPAIDPDVGAFRARCTDDGAFLIMILASDGHGISDHSTGWPANCTRPSVHSIKSDARKRQCFPILRAGIRFRRARLMTVFG